MLKKGTARVEVEAIDPREWKKSKRAHKRAAAKAAKASEVVTAAAQATNNSENAEAMATKRQYLQVAAYKSLTAAQALQNRLLDSLQAMNEAANVVIHPSPQGVYRVRIGPFSSTVESLPIKNAASLASFGKMHTVYE